MPIISFKLNGDSALSSKANHLKGKKLTVNFLVVCSLNIVFQVLAAADMINVNPCQAPSSRQQFPILIGNILLNALTLSRKNVHSDWLIVGHYSSVSRADYRRAKTKQKVI